MKIFSILGPGLIAANAGNDAGAIATHSSAGASYGYGLLWVMVVISVPLILVQEMCARMGAVTGKGLADLIRERFGVRWTTFAMLVLLVANAGTIVSEFAGIAAAMELFGVTKYISVPIGAAGIWWLVTRGNYARVEKVFLAMTFAFFGYIAAAILARPDWGEVGRNIVVPTFKLDGGFIFLLVALIGTTITPYMQLFVQSTVVEKGVNTANYAATRLDVAFGSVFANFVVIFIQIATAATLHVQGVQVDSAEDAARALIPIAGPYAFALFGLGLLGASILAAGVLPLATAFAICEAFGFEKGVTRDFDEAPEFYTLFTGLIIVGALITLIPGLSLLQLLLVVQVANGMLLPLILVFVTLLASDKELLRGWENGPIVKVLAWATTFIVGALALLYIAISFVLPLFGMRL